LLRLAYFANAGFTAMYAGLANSGPFDETKQALKATVIRDTITVNANSTLVLRYVANNPGVWFMHCHIGGFQLCMQIW
jgi:iron transport multicopper oxidase